MRGTAVISELPYLLLFIGEGAVEFVAALLAPALLARNLSYFVNYFLDTCLLGYGLDSVAKSLVVLHF